MKETRAAQAFPPSTFSLQTPKEAKPSHSLKFKAWEERGWAAGPRWNSTGRRRASHRRWGPAGAGR